MQLVLDTAGLVLKHRNGCFLVVGKDREVLINPARINSIAVTAPCTLSTAAIRLALQKDVLVYFINALGKVEGRLWSASFGRWAGIRRKQCLYGLHAEATDWIIRLMILKTQGQLRNLMYLLDRRPGQAALISQARQVLEQGIGHWPSFRGRLPVDCREAIMGYEGRLARVYWPVLTACLPPDWQFETRNRQPAVDPFNAALNYLYGMLYGTVETALFSAGLDPHQGLLHGDQYDRPTLSYDLIEPFRPWADRLLLEAILAGKLSPSCFNQAETGEVTVAKAGKACLIPLLNQYLHDQGVFEEKRTRRRNHIYQLAGTYATMLEHFAI